MSYEFGSFRLRVAERMLLRAGEVVPLTPRVFDLLVLLVERHGHLLEREVLLSAVWADSFVEEANLTVSISALRKALGEQADGRPYIETVSKRGYRFIADVSETNDRAGESIVCEPLRSDMVSEETRGTTKPQSDLKPLSANAQGTAERPALGLPCLPASCELFEPVGGAVALDSSFYIVRAADEQFQSAIARGDGIVLVKGARQVGKTSLLARGLEKAREAGATVALTDFQMLNAAHLQSADAFLLALAGLLAEQLDLEVQPEVIWKASRGPSINLDRYLRQEALDKISSPIVWGLDEIDRLFTCDFAGEIFGLFRSWHNRRALDPAGPWRRLTLAIAYATEAHLFITDLNQSPFNVGTRLVLEDFTPMQVAELNRRYHDVIKSQDELNRFYRLVGGHPYLVRRGLHELASRKLSFAAFEDQAARDEFFYGDHLRRMLVLLARDPELSAVMRGVLNGQPCPTPESFERLRSAGLVTGHFPQEARPRCRLYTMYLRRHLS